VLQTLPHFGPSRRLNVRTNPPRNLASIDCSSNSPLTTCNADWGQKVPRGRWNCWESGNPRVRMAPLPRANTARGAPRREIHEFVYRWRPCRFLRSEVQPQPPQYGRRDDLRSKGLSVCANENENSGDVGAAPRRFMFPDVACRCVVRAGRDASGTKEGLRADCGAKGASQGVGPALDVFVALGFYHHAG
jgi:hypothetical protein